MRHIIETSKMQTNGYFSTFFVLQRDETVRKLCEKFEIATLIEPLRKPDLETLGQFTTPYHKGVQTLSIPRIHCRPSSLPEFLLERSNHHLLVEFLSNLYCKAMRTIFQAQHCAPKRNSVLLGRVLKSIFLFTIHS